MRNIRNIFIAALFFLGLLLLTKFIFLPRGQILEEWSLYQEGAPEQARNVVLPAYFFPEESGTWYFTRNLSITDSEVNTIHLPRINAYAFSVMLNDNIIFQQGDFDYPTANLWNYSYLVNLPPHLIQKNNEIKIKVYALHDLGFIRPPAAGSKSDFLLLSEIQNGFSNILTFIMLGATVLIGIILVLLSLKSTASKRAYIYFGIACLFYLFYCFELSYRLYTGSLEVYIWIRKFLLCSYIIGLFFLIKGLLLYLYEKMISWKITLLLIPALLPLLAARDFVKLSNTLKIYNMAIIIVIIVLVILFYRRPKSKLVFSVTFCAATVLHAVIVFSFNLYEITFFVAGTTTLMIGVIFNLITEFNAIENNNITLNRKIVIDPLTKAFNREFLDRTTIRENDYILFFDFDCFKKYNDTLGHRKGDELLIDFTAKAKAIIRKEDCVIRYGGDEFIIILRLAVEKVCSKTAETLRDYIRQNYEYVDLSYGISRGTGGGTAETLKLADQQMYEMKKAGKR